MPPTQPRGLGMAARIAEPATMVFTAATTAAIVVVRAHETPRLVALAAATSPP
jgi:hypothetical protein